MLRTTQRLPAALRNDASLGGLSTMSGQHFIPRASSGRIVRFVTVVAFGTACAACRHEPQLIENRHIRALTVAREGQVLWLKNNRPFHYKVPRFVPRL